MSKWTSLSDDDREYLHQRRQFFKGLIEECKEKNLDEWISINESVSNHIKSILVRGGYYQEDVDTLNTLEISASKQLSH